MPTAAVPDPRGSTAYVTRQARNQRGNRAIPQSPQILWNMFDC